MNRALSRWGVVSLLTALTASILPAQVDLLIANTSNGAYPDSVTMVDQTGAQRPLAQHPATGTTTSFTGSVVSSPLHLHIGGTDYLYWFDNISDRVIRGTDSNGNGVIDPVEFEVLFDRAADLSPSNTSPDTMRHVNGKFYLSNDLGTATRGVLVLEDLTGDFDFNDPGEQSEIVNGFTGSSGSTIVVSGVTTSSDDIEMADALSDGDVIWACDDDKVVFRWDSTTATHSVFLNYNATFSAASGALPANPDFVGGLLPIPGSLSGTSEDVDRITVDLATDCVYLAVNFEDDEPWIFKCADGNADGDANDAGEVTLFWDGNLEASLTKPAIDDIFWYQGSVYLSIEEDPSGGASQGRFVQLTDLNADGDANDAGEYTLLGSLAVGDDPTTLGFSVVPAGTWATPSCVGFEIDHTPVTSAGGTLVFTCNDIPAAYQGGSDVLFVGLSTTGPGGTTVSPACTIGLDIDALTLAGVGPLLLPFLSSGPITSGTASTAGLPYGPGLPVGTTVWYVGGIIGAPGLTISHSRVIVSE